MIVSLWTWIPPEVYEETSVRSATEQLMRAKLVNAGGDPDTVKIVWSEDVIFGDDGDRVPVMLCRGEARPVTPETP